MKRLYLLLLLSVAFFLPEGAEAQTPTGGVVLIGDTADMTTCSYLPYRSLGSSYTQQIVTRGELVSSGASGDNQGFMITGMDLYCEQASSTGRAGCTIYLANTYVQGLDFQHQNGLVPFGAPFQLVAVDSLVCSLGWNHYEFDSAFHYNGLGNLIVAFDCPWGMGGSFYCEQTQSSVSRYVETRLGSITPSTRDHTTAYRNIMRLHTQPVSAPAASCPAPTLRVDSVGAAAVKVSWSPGYQDTSWRVECVADGDSAWRSSGLVWGDTSYTLGGLTPNTDYTVRLTAYCTDTFTTVYRHVLTHCLPEALPYAEGFEESIYVPACWRTAAGSTGTHPETIYGGGYGFSAHGGSRGLKLNGGTAILPLMDAPTDSLELSFWANNGSTNAALDLYVGVVVDPLDESTFVPVDTVAVSRYMGWMPFVVRFDRYAAPSGNIAIKSGTYVTYLYIDDVEVHRVMPCQTITTVNVGQITDTADVVHWVDSDAVYYEVAYGTAGFTIDSTHIVTDIRTDSLLLGGLTPYTVYDVYVRSYCGSFNTNWSLVRSFRTRCSLFDTLPFVENFDSFTGYPKPPEFPCWMGHTGMNTCVVNPTGGGYSGLRALRWDNDADQYAVLPGINTAVHPVRTLQLSFWACNDYYNSTSARLMVGVMTDPEVDSTFQPVDSVTITGVDWHRYDIPLGSYTGTGGYITLRSIAGDYRYAYIDDIIIDLLAPCPSVTGVALTGLTATSATLGWDNADSGTVWQVSFDTVATALPAAGTTVLSSPACTLDGLDSGMTYYVWVRAICPKGDTSAWEGPIQVVPGEWNMRANRSDTLTLCGVSLYDDGGPEGDFSYQHSTLAILPDMPGHLVSISGYCNIGGSSTLTIYDGVGTSGSVLWTKGLNVSNAVNFGPVISETGALTIDFRGSTPFSTYYEGFELHVGCIPDTCVVHHLRLDPAVTASDSMLSLTWDCNGASFYEVEYGPVGFASGTGTMVSTSSNHFAITGLASLDRREVHVRSVCGVEPGVTEGDTGAWVSAIFTTQPCSDAVFRVNYDSVGLSSDSNPNVPIGFNGYRYSYVQTLVDSAHLAGLEGGITAMAFHPVNHVAGDHQNNMTVYLANVPDTAFGNSPIMPDAGHRFVKVIDSANFCHDATDEWQLIHFDHPFMWDGRQNLLVAVLREDGGSGSRVEYACHHRYSDIMNQVNRSYMVHSDSPLCIDSALSYTYPYYQSYGTWDVGDLRLYTNTCDLPLCTAPVVDSVVTGYESATVSWNGTGNQYQISITPGYTVLYPVNGNEYTFTGLQPATTYQATLRQDCNADSLGFSDFVTVQFTTDSFLCPAPDSLRVYDITRNSATFDWAAGTDTLWQLEIWTQGNRHVSYFVSEHPFTVDNIDAGNEYFARLHGYCGSVGQIAGAWSDTLFFATPFCPDVTGLDTAAVTTTSVTLVWDAVQEGPVADQNYMLEYGPAGFTLGSGTEQPVVGTTCTIAGLTPATAYDFYLRAVCAEDWYSSQYSALLNVVTRRGVGIAPVADSGGFSALLVPNPAKGVTTLHVNGLPTDARALEVSVADVTGREVLRRSAEFPGTCSLVLDVSSLPAGAYFVRIDCGGATVVRRLIIK